MIYATCSWAVGANSERSLSASPTSRWSTSLVSPSLFNTRLKTRRVHVAGIAHQVYGKWAEQVARNLTDPVDGFLKDMRYLAGNTCPLSS